ncbi:MAG: hypothetical protein K0R28_1473 [Paenibacillus sp.]|jgi:membrane protease YdiL (CAAX protease family)|nr:hypothetical protein [Paenibacillus sp.]
MLLLFKGDRRIPLGLQGNRKAALFTGGSIYGILLVLITVAAVYCVGETKIVDYSLEQAVWVSFGLLALIALCDTFTEEILLRGYIQGIIKAHYGVWTGILLSAVPFAVLHSLGHDVFSHPFDLLNLTLAGVFLALLRELSGSLWLPIGVHFTWNAFNNAFDTKDSFVQIEFGPNEWISGGALGFENGLANTLIMLTIIVVLGFRLKRDRAAISDATAAG